MKKPLIRRFHPWMVEALKTHLEEGWSLSTFPVKHNIDKPSWGGIIKKSDELLDIRQQYMKALHDKRRFNYYKEVKIDEAKKI